MNSIESTFGIGRLIAKQLTDALDAAEQRKLDAWLKEDEKHTAIFNRIVAHESLAAALSEMQQIDTELALANVKSRISETRGGKQLKLWPRIAVAAAAVIGLAIFVYFFSAPRHPELVSGSPLANDIAPGKNTATLTLANGKTINLSDAKTGVVINATKLAYNDGSTVAALSASGGEMPERQRGGVQTLTASTPRGGTYQVILPDGTKVWLNADSKISFPVQFSGGIRKILLSGEAYFEVAKVYTNPSLPKGISPQRGERNGRVPFIVVTDKQEVTVLGTHFNISAYKDEASVKTTLLEGSVRVAPLSASGGEMPNGQRGGKTPNSSLSRSDISPRGGESSIVLKPSQQSIVSGSNRITVANVDVNEAVAWKNGDFIFDQEDFESVLRKVEKWYAVEFVYQKGAFEKLKISGNVSRSKNISSVLEALQLTSKLKFKIEGRRVIIM